MTHYRLDLEYDGSDFHGWQVQPGQRTVQGELQRAVERVCRGATRLVGAGRTDAGVHALAQVASFGADAAPAPPRFLVALNALLPPDVRVTRLSIVPEDFSARASALSRRYRYRWLRHESALGRRYFHILRHRIDAAAMHEAAVSLLGEHDFTAFAASGSGGETRLCTILHACVESAGGLVTFEITANRFLHNKVRRLAGALVEIGRGRLRPAQLLEIVRAQDSSRGGPCLPPCGLYLVEVRYPAELESAATAVVDAAAPDP